MGLVATHRWVMAGRPSTSAWTTRWRVVAGPCQSRRSARSVLANSAWPTSTRERRPVAPNVARSTWCPGRPTAVPSGVAETIYKIQPEPAVEKWQVRTPDGRVYGPVPKSELDQWVKEGRIPAEAVLLNESVGELAAGGRGLSPATALGPLSAASNPFTEQPSANPFRAPSAASPGAYRRPHRGTLILIFGILGWIICFIFAPMAWVDGSCGSAGNAPGSDGRQRHVAHPGRYDPRHDLHHSLPCSSSSSSASAASCPEGNSRCHG